MASITNQLRDLLLRKTTPTSFGSSFESRMDQTGDQEQEPHWEYDHNQWKYKDVWPKGAYTGSFLAFLLFDVYWSLFGYTLSCLVG